MPFEYTTRELMEAVRTALPYNGFMANTFFQGTKTHIAEVIEVDVKKGRRKMAPFVSPRRGGKIMTRDGFHTNTIRCPKIAPEMILTVDDITKRAFGENVYSNDTPEQRRDKLLAQDLNDLQESIERRKGWMARQVILDGGFDVVDKEDGVDIHVDYGFTNKEVLTGDEAWSKGTSDPDEILLEKRLEILKSSGVCPNMMIGDAKTIRLYLKHPQVQKNANILNIKDARIEPRIVDDNVTFYGRIASLDMDIYSFDEWFINDDTKKEEPFIPYGTIILANSGGIGKWHYGAVTQVEPGSGFKTYEAEIVPKYTMDEKNDLETLRETSRPLPVPDDVDSWAVLIVDKQAAG